jgi:hypothetical protein
VKFQSSISFVSCDNERNDTNEDDALEARLEKLIVKLECDIVVWTISGEGIDKLEVSCLFRIGIFSAVNNRSRKRESAVRNTS